MQESVLNPKEDWWRDRAEEEETARKQPSISHAIDEKASFSPVPAVHLRLGVQELQDLVPYPAGLEQVEGVKKKFEVKCWGWC